MNEQPGCLVIPAAGSGSRMMTISLDMPKEMLPVLHKPAIQYAVDEGLSAGIRDIAIVINRTKEIIREYFEERKIRKKLYPSEVDEMDRIAASCKITFLYQKGFRGEADAISLAREIAGNSPLALIYPDNIYFPAPGALGILKAAFGKHRMDMNALMEVNEENARAISNSGRVSLAPLEGDIYRITRIYPKEPGHFVPRMKGELRTCGMSIALPHIFEYIERARSRHVDGELTDGPVRSLMLEEGILGCRLPGRVFDIGNPAGYELCLESAGTGHSGKNN